MRNQLIERWRVIAFGLFLVCGLLLAFLVDLPSLEQLRHWTEVYGAWSILLFALLYVTVTQFPIPRTALTVSSGILFGPALGITIALLSTTVAAVVSLTLLRALLDVPSDPTKAADSVLGRWARKQGGHPALSKVNERLEHRGWFSVMCLRLIPGLPFSILNYACVFTPVKRLDFAFATFVGSAPSTIIGVLLGDSLTTGQHQSTALLLGALGLVGMVGLVVDLLLPVKSKA
ncbi:SNARE associated Golgi protein [Corynebacterium kalinowskii]|uniref:TVP38/TMEM64 family membrane protein n=1 Tax=Corynebacterium kalinowskii TaxID=2675216 RepID=A0A6B8W3J9_9CORY|nr:TVP38/TMEM64 family protein [Corynebacterium kalinowskii]QGU02038.1 SNARE associated Golgi protein [Corynebacterium kalinowskii]